MKKKYFILLLLFFSFLSSTLFSQNPVKLEIKNSKIKYKSFNYSVINDNSFKVSITDENDEQITGLTKTDFKVTKFKKDGEITEIIPLSEVGDTRVRLALTIDNSFSMKQYVNDVLVILDDMINNLGKGFYVSVILFDELIDNVSKDENKLKVRKLPFTKDIQRVKEYYKNGLSNLSSGTYLYDAIKTTLNVFKEDTLSKVDKNIIVVLSDGYDINSKTSLKEVENLNKSNITFYTIDFMHSSRESGRKNEFLEIVATKTKGEYFSPNNIITLRENFKRIATKIVNLGYEVRFQFKYPKPTLTYNVDETEISKRPEAYRSFPGLLLEEIKIKESFPLLNYVFFDKNSDILSNRYILFSSPEETNNFSENKIEGGAIEHYYNLLNIYSERLKNNPSATITLIGATDGTEKDWKKLSMNRALSVKKYFTDIWGIDSSRILVKNLKLPSKPSSSSKEEGKTENRRVEIISDNWEIIKPVTFIQNSLNITPKKIDFSVNGGDSVIIEELNLEILNNNNLWNNYSIQNKSNAIISYDWKSKDGEMPEDSDELTFILSAKDNGLDEGKSEKITQQVKQITSEMSKAENIQEKKIEKVSLILFDFDSFNPGEKNEKIMNEYVYPKLSDTSLYIAINGYTDNIGKPEYNLKLSSKRAEAIYNSIINLYNKERVKYIGNGANNPLYKNDLPEGRFYNRTVQLLLQNFQFE